MLLYSFPVTSRVAYIAEFIGKELFQQALDITDDNEKFINHPGPKINYSPQPLASNEFWIHNADLLFEKGIENLSITCFEINGYKAFFKNHACDFPFDIFAAAFFIKSL